MPGRGIFFARLCASLYCSAAPVQRGLIVATAAWAVDAPLGTQVRVSMPAIAAIYQSVSLSLCADFLPGDPDNGLGIVNWRDRGSLPSGIELIAQ